MSKKLDTAKFLESLKRLKTPANYAKDYKGKTGEPVKRQYIAKLIKEKKIPSVYIDGIPFVIIDEETEKKEEKKEGK